MNGVSADFLSAATKALARQHGDRATSDIASLNRLIEGLKQAEQAYLELPKFEKRKGRKR